MSPQDHIDTWDGPVGPGAPLRLAIKRLLDVLLSVGAMIAFSPILIITAAAIKVSSPGPIFYRGVRAGRYGKPFRIFKFRTMVVDAERLGGPTTGTRDPRVTRIGTFLRRTKLDELPQFLNVLTGDMSLVGPRPEVLEYTSRYAGEERIILAMRPGITDHASIEFADLDDLVGSEDPDKHFQEHILPKKNALRSRYVREWSLRSDFSLLWHTAFRVARRIASR